MVNPLVNVYVTTLLGSAGGPGKTTVTVCWPVVAPAGSVMLLVTSVWLT
jgi:hypothetical protein